MLHQLLNINRLTTLLHYVVNVWNVSLLFFVDALDEHTDTTIICWQEIKCLDKYVAEEKQWNYKGTVVFGCKYRDMDLIEIESCNLSVVHLVQEMPRQATFSQELWHQIRWTLKHCCSLAITLLPVPASQTLQEMSLYDPHIAYKRWENHMLRLPCPVGVM